MMLVKKISFENFRSFRDKTELDLQNINIFVGPNKAGKSNIIMCFQFLNSISRNDWNDLFIDNVFDYDKNMRITIQIVFYLNIEERRDLVRRFFPNISHVDFEVNKIFQEIKYLIIVENNRIYKEILSVQNTQGKYKDLIIHEFEGAVPNQYVLDLDGFSGIHEANEFDNIDLKKRYGKWHETRSMFDVNEKTSEYNIGGIVVGFFGRIRIFSSANIQNNIHLGDIIQEKIDKAVRDYIKFLNLTSEMIEIPNIQINRNRPAAIAYDDRSESRTKYSLLEFEEHGLNSRLAFSSLSYGSQQLLHLLVLIEDAGPDEIICIEEPENHLHSHIQKKIFRRIVEKSEAHDLQFLITTHSPVFTALEKGIITYLITRSNAVSKATVIESDSQLKLIKQHLGIENSDIYLSQYVIFVEGHSEEASIKIVGPAMGYNQIGKEIRIINFGGKDRIPRLTEFLKYIHYFDTIAIVLADGHSDIKNLWKT